MEERAIHISSINRERRGTSRPGDFTIKFNPPLKLDPEMKHQLALDRLSMTYSWYNIRSCLLYTSPSPRDGLLSRMPSSA